MGKRIVIVGAGYAGIEAALTMNKKRAKREDFEVTLIDKNPYHTLLTELHEVAGNRISEEGIRISLRDIFKFTKVRVVTDEINAFDFENKSINSDTAKYDYDYLVLAMGSTPNFIHIKGLKRNAFTLWSFDDAVKIREHIKKCFIIAENTSDLEERKKLLTFVIAGAGFTGVEMIGELAHWSRQLAKIHKIKKDEVKLIIVDMLSSLLSTMDQEISDKTHKYMEKKLGINIILSTRISEVTPDGFISDENFIPSKTIIWAAGIRGSENVDSMPIEKVKGERLKVDKYCKTDKENVYAVGDVCALTDSDNVPYPAMVENAVQTGHGVAINILNDMRGKELKKVKVKMHGNMVSIGSCYAVSNIMGKKLPVWLSIIMKYGVNIHYLWEIMGFSGVSTYLYHEFIEKKQRKHLLEKHWSMKMQAWWLTPLRVFLGFTWLYEGIKKIWEGWLTYPKLASFLGFVTDATSSASPATETVTTTPVVQTTLFNLDLGFIKIILNKTSEMIFKIDIPIITNMLKSTLSNDDTQVLFQVVILIAEIAIGLALISGTFTFISSTASLGLTFMFITSTGIYEKTWWMIFAAIACMGGAGRAFGVDYYLIPYLNNVWEYFWKNKKLRLIFKNSLKRWDY